MNAEVNVIDQLLKKYPDRKICYDEYIELKLREENEAICRLIYNSADRDGINTGTEWNGRKEWLEMQGFVFPDVERDMFCEPYSIDECQFATLDELIEFSYNKVALLGEVVVSEIFGDELEARGQLAFDKLIRHKQCLTPFEQKLLVFHMVQTIRDWDADTEDSDLKFWERVFTSYGASDLCQSTQKPYLTICALVEHVLEHNKRYFVTKKNSKRSKRYYVSMMTHALAPKRKTVALLRLLFGFYEDSLQYQYRPDDDVAFEVFVNSLKERWNDNIHGTEEIRSDVVSPGIKTLTENRKQYMIKLCNTLLGKIDSLIAGDSSELYRAFSTGIN